MNLIWRIILKFLDVFNNGITLLHYGVSPQNEKVDGSVSGKIKRQDVH